PAAATTYRRLRKCNTASGDSCCASRALPLCFAKAWKSRTALGSVVVTRRTWPLSICASAFLARRIGSGQVSPLASTSCWNAGRSATDSKALMDPLLHAGHCCRQCLGVRAAAHGHVGAATALAANLAGDKADQVARLHLAGEVGRDPRHQADLAFAAGAGKQDDSRLEAVFEVVDHAPQGVGIDKIG